MAAAAALGMVNNVLGVGAVGVGTFDEFGAYGTSNAASEAAAAVPLRRRLDWLIPSYLENPDAFAQTEDMDFGSILTIAASNIAFGIGCFFIYELFRGKGVSALTTKKTTSIPCHTIAPRCYCCRRRMLGAPAVMSLNVEYFTKAVVRVVAHFKRPLLHDDHTTTKAYR